MTNWISVLPKFVMRHLETVTGLQLSSIYFNFVDFNPDTAISQHLDLLQSFTFPLLSVPQYRVALSSLSAHIKCKNVWVWKIARFVMHILHDS